jgi:hypothetical protein
MRNVTSLVENPLRAYEKIISNDIRILCADGFVHEENDENMSME